MSKIPARNAGNRTSHKPVKFSAEGSGTWANSPVGSSFIAMTWHPNSARSFLVITQPAPLMLSRTTLNFFAAIVSFSTIARTLARCTALELSLQLGCPHAEGSTGVKALSKYRCLIFAAASAGGPPPLSSSNFMPLYWHRYFLLVRRGPTKIIYRETRLNVILTNY